LLGSTASLACLGTTMKQYRQIGPGKAGIDPRLHLLEVAVRCYHLLAPPVDDVRIRLLSSELDTGSHKIPDHHGQWCQQWTTPAKMSIYNPPAAGHALRSVPSPVRAPLTYSRRLFDALSYTPERCTQVFNSDGSTDTAAFVTGAPGASDSGISNTHTPSGGAN
jgi:hypothetical protein